MYSQVQVLRSTCTAVLRSAPLYLQVPLVGSYLLIRLSTVALNLLGSSVISKYFEVHKILDACFRFGRTMYRQVPEVVLICLSIFIFRQNLARSELNLVTCKYIGFGWLCAVFAQPQKTVS